MRCALACAVLACGGSGLPPPSDPPPPPERTAATQEDVSRLLVDLAARDACDMLRGKFVGLPEDDAPTGADAGLAAMTGRWWVRECEAVPTGDDALVLRLSGPGWQWVDREESGFRVRQYVHFRSEAEVVGRLDARYEDEERVASIWLSPSRRPDVSLTSVGRVDASPEGFFATLAGLFTDEDARARESVRRIGSRQFANRLSGGVTVTYDLDRRQVDLLLAALPAGTTPRRPFEGEGPWLANERQRFFRGDAAIHLVGPFDARADALLDVRVEHGSDVRFRAACEQSVEEAFAPLAEGRAPSLPEAVEGQEGGPLEGGPSSRALRVPDCRWYLVTTAQSGRIVVWLR